MNPEDKRGGVGGGRSWVTGSLPPAYVVELVHGGKCTDVNEGPQQWHRVRWSYYGGVRRANRYAQTGDGNHSLPQGRRLLHPSKNDSGHDPVDHTREEGGGEKRNLIAAHTNSGS